MEIKSLFPYSSFSSQTVFISDYSLEKPIINSWIQAEVNDYSSLTDKRLEYIDSLRDLPSVWIDGQSERPDDIAINTSKNLLEAIRQFILLRERSLRDQMHIASNPSLFATETPIEDLKQYQTPIPKLVMGPIPSGGIELEFYLNEDNAIYVFVPNGRKKVIVEAQKNGYYFEVEHEQEDSAGALLNEYKSFSY